jgi:hypothetical protein
MIFNDDTGAKPAGERLRNEPGGNVGRPASWEGNDDLDGSFRKVPGTACLQGCSGDEQCEQGKPVSRP